MSNRSFLIATVMLPLIALGGCASAPDDAAAQGTGEKGTTHVVMCWLKEPGSADARRQLIERSKTFTQIPGIKSVSVGPPLPSTRPVVDSSFDVGIVMHFESEQALRNYDHNPIHQQAVKEVLQPLVKKLVIYDFKNE